jgi:hypothetical protein
METKANQEIDTDVLDYCVQFLGAADGKIRNREPGREQDFGVDIFTPFVASKSIIPLGAAKALLTAGLKIIHAVSVCDMDENGQMGRLDCSNPHGPLSKRGFGQWWSIPFFEYNNVNALTQALIRGRAGRNAHQKLPVVGFLELEQYVKKQIATLIEGHPEYAGEDDMEKLDEPTRDLMEDLLGSQSTITAIRALRRPARGLPNYDQASQLIDLNCTLILYAPSSLPSDGQGALWSNSASRSTTNRASGQDLTDPSQMSTSGFQ